MKKFLMILMAIMLVLVNVAALAEEGNEPPELNEDKVGGLLGTAESPSAPVITKTYVSNVDGVYPTETLEFTVNKGNEEYPDVSVGTNNTFDVTGVETIDIPVNVPAASAYKKAGRYHYEVVETSEQTEPSQGATYSATTFNVDVYITYKIVDNKVTNELEKTVLVYSGNEVTEGNASVESKTDDFENKYSVGGLTVTKAITGNLADPEKDFTIVITLNTEEGKYVNNDITVAVGDNGKASVDTTTGTKINKGWTGEKTITLTAKGDGSVTLSNIPEGVTYTITETLPERLAEDTPSAQLNAVNNPNAYFVTGEVTTAKQIGNTTKDETITNKKGITVPTGIALDTVPYILILAVALFGLVKMGLRKREEY